jgi:hypothetical protein
MAGSSIGIMDPAYFVGRKEILTWVNDTFSLNYTKIEDTASGRQPNSIAVECWRSPRPAGLFFCTGSFFSSRVFLVLRFSFRACWNPVPLTVVAPGAVACQIADAIYPGLYAVRLHSRCCLMCAPDTSGLRRQLRAGCQLCVIAPLKPVCPAPACR